MCILSKGGPLKSLHHPHICGAAESMFRAMSFQVTCPLSTLDCWTVGVSFALAVERETHDTHFQTWQGADKGLVVMWEEEELGGGVTVGHCPDWGSRSGSLSAPLLKGGEHCGETAMGAPGCSDRGLQGRRGAAGWQWGWGGREGGVAEWCEWRRRRTGGPSGLSFLLCVF